MERNYLSVGSLRVAGKYLQAAPAEAGTTVSFEIAIPAAYYVLTEDGSSGGMLDGRNCGGSVYLGAGTHEYRTVGGESSVALVWAQAIDRGFRPVWPKQAMP